jgi:hypothetical protein
MHSGILIIVFKIHGKRRKREAWFANTIFVFVGDHGVAGNAEAMYPPVWTEQRLTD